MSSNPMNRLCCASMKNSGKVQILKMITVENGKERARKLSAKSILKVLDLLNSISLIIEMWAKGQKLAALCGKVTKTMSKEIESCWGKKIRIKPLIKKAQAER